LCSNLSAQIAFVPDSFSSSSLKFSLAAAADVAAVDDISPQEDLSSAREDWLASVQLKLKLFESQAALVSQVRFIHLLCYFFK
jgi:hypothetical protein